MIHRAICAAVLALCFAFPQAHAADAVKFGISPHPDSLLPLIGSDAGKAWYKAENLTVDFEMMRWRDLPNAVATGKVDVAISDLAMVVANHEKHPDLVYWYGISTMDNGYALMIRPGGSLKTVEQLAETLHDHGQAVQAATLQLRDRTVIVTGQSEMEQALSIIARNAGLHFAKDDSSEIKTIDLRPDDGLKAFEAGQGDAFMAPLVQHMLAEKAGMVEMLSGADFGAAPIVGFITTRSYADSHRAEMLKLLHLWFRTVNFVQGNEHEAAEIVAAAMAKGGTPGFTAADFEASWQTLEHYPLSAQDAANAILDPDGPNYWKMRQQQCSLYFCSVAEVLPEPVDSDKEFLMPQVQADYLAKYGSTAGK